MFVATFSYFVLFYCKTCISMPYILVNNAFIQINVTEKDLILLNHYVLEIKNIMSAQVRKQYSINPVFLKIFLAIIPIIC